MGVLATQMRGLNYTLMKGAEFLFLIISQVEIDIVCNITYQHLNNDTPNDSLRYC